MSKLFSCVDDKTIKLYYQDVDSVHLNYDDVDEVVESYKENMGHS